MARRIDAAGRTCSQPKPEWVVVGWALRFSRRKTMSRDEEDAMNFNTFLMVAGFLVGLTVGFLIFAQFGGVGGCGVLCMMFR
jgi:hypothetical protein